MTHYTLQLSKNGDALLLRKNLKELTSIDIDADSKLPESLKVILMKTKACHTRKNVLNLLSELKNELANFSKLINIHSAKVEDNIYVIQKKNETLKQKEISLTLLHPNNFKYPNHTAYLLFNLIPYAPCHECPIDNMISFVERLEKFYCKTVHHINKYKPELAGHSTIYVHGPLFQETRALLSGKRKLFANLRAWWSNDGHLFADTSATLSGKRCLFANTRNFFWKKKNNSALQQDEQQCPHNNSNKINRLVPPSKKI